MSLQLDLQLVAVLDGSAALVVSLLGAIWVVEDPAHGHPASSLMMLVMLLLVVRAALVPSSWRRTLSVGLVTLAPVLVAAPASIPADVMMRDVPLRQIVAVVTTSFAVATLAVTVLTSVVIYRGVQQDIGPIALSSEYEQTGIDLADLPEFTRQTVETTISAGSLTEAREIVDRLRRQAEAAG